MQDIFDRKRADEHQELLVNELRHRIKNTLATVQAIAVQTLRNADTLADAEMTLSARLIALSQAHDVLTRENWDGAEVMDIVTDVLQIHQGTGPETIRAVGPPVRIRPRTAVSLAMVLHELATNALKHGALSNEAGRVDVVWRADYERGAGQVWLRWKESRGPPVAPPSRRGFGTRLIERSLAAEQGGAVEIAYHRTGVVCTLSFPMLASELSIASA